MILNHQTIARLIRVAQLDKSSAIMQADVLNFIRFPARMQIPTAVAQLVEHGQFAALPLNRIHDRTSETERSGY